MKRQKIVQWLLFRKLHTNSQKRFCRRVFRQLNSTKIFGNHKVNVNYWMTYTGKYNEENEQFWSKDCSRERTDLKDKLKYRNSFWHFHEKNTTFVIDYLDNRRREITLRTITKTKLWNGNKVNKLNVLQMFKRCIRIQQKFEWF